MSQVATIGRSGSSCGVVPETDHPVPSVGRFRSGRPKRTSRRARAREPLDRPRERWTETDAFSGRMVQSSSGAGASMVGPRCRKPTRAQARVTPKRRRTVPEPTRSPALPCSGCGPLRMCGSGASATDAPARSRLGERGQSRRLERNRAPSAVPWAIKLLRTPQLPASLQRARDPTYDAAKGVATPPRLQPVASVPHGRRTSPRRARPGSRRRSTSRFRRARRRAR